MDKLKVILTGATGMVGEGVLRVCLEDPRVESVLVIGRKTASPAPWRRPTRTVGKAMTIASKG